MLLSSPQTFGALSCIFFFFLINEVQQLWQIVPHIKNHLKFLLAALVLHLTLDRKDLVLYKVAEVLYGGGGMVSLFSSDAERRRRSWEFEFAGMVLLILLVLEGVHGASSKFALLEERVLSISFYY